MAGKGSSTMKLNRRRSLVAAVVVVVALTFVALRTVSTRRRQPFATTYPPKSSAKLVHVVDGDTVYFALESGQWIKGRLAGINTPECHKEQVGIGRGRRSARCTEDDEFFGVAAYKQLRSLLRAGPIRLDCQRKRDGRCKRGSHGRVLVTIRVAGRDVAEQMVRAGAALTYTKYRSGDRARLCAAELSARRAKRGMWAAGSVNEVMAMMSQRTRRWYKDHDRRCRRAMRPKTKR
jgi:endonuclease YncB( thermonuclease family)